MQLVEAVVVEIIEERFRADRVVGHFEIVNTVVPVVGNRVDHSVCVFSAPSVAPIVQCSAPMQRDLRRLADTKFDVIVVGAGFYGVTTAWDAAQRGPVGRDHRQGRFRRRHLVQQPQDAARRPALAAGAQLHRRCGCSSASDARWRGSCRTWSGRCRSWCRRPAIRSAARWRCGSRLAINDAVARDRNDGLPDPGTHLPDSRIVSREEALRLNPVIAPEGVTGGAVWYDYQMQSTDRVTLSFLLSAVDAGAMRGELRAGAALPAAERQGDRREGRGSAHQRDLRDPQRRGRERRRAVGGGAACRSRPPPPRARRRPACRAR